MLPRRKTFIAARLCQADWFSAVRTRFPFRFSLFDGLCTEECFLHPSVHESGLLQQGFFIEFVHVSPHDLSFDVMVQIRLTDADLLAVSACPEFAVVNTLADCASAKFEPCGNFAEGKEVIQCTHVPVIDQCVLSTSLQNSCQRSASSFSFSVAERSNLKSDSKSPTFLPLA
jgi:hypothetical protein